MPPATSRRFPMLSKLMSVCSSWRSAILESPAFWERPDLHKADLASSMITHAKDMPLVLCLDQDLNSPRAGNVTTSVARARELYVRSYIPRALAAMFLCMEQGAPLLEVFDVETTRDVTVPIFTGGVHPRLWCLRISGWPSFMKSGIDKLAASLTELSLQHFYGSNAPVPAEICSILQNLPLLENLLLYRSARGGTEPEEVASLFRELEDNMYMPRVKLSRLQSMKIMDTMDICIYMYCRLAFPSSTRIALTIPDAHPPTLRDLAVLSGDLHRHMSALDTFNRLTFDDSGFTFHVFFAGHPLPTVSLTCLDLDIDPARIDKLQIVLHYLAPSLLPVHELRCVSQLQYNPLEATVPAHHAALVMRGAQERLRALAALHGAILPRVERLVVSGQWAHAFCGAMGDACSPDYDVEEIVPAEICTRELQIVDSTQVASAELAALKTYLGVLQHKRRHRLNRLIIQGCSRITADAMNEHALEDVVDEVVFEA